MFTEETVRYVFDRCPTCHMGFLLPGSFLQRQKDLNQDIHCPQGHRYVYRANVAEDLRRPLTQERERADRNWQECRKRDRVIAALRGLVTKLKKLRGKR